ncbi:unnamed protein product [Blepharisma stoltei]|uniref:Uncharacterized protein n=1 Tax=Blepharisma stoltei TaxID=1481888 RepID=A0AAU9K2J6_9CILI|nr:unnamed protein product [Blepharisma stoltei]
MWLTIKNYWLLPRHAHSSGDTSVHYFNICRKHSLKHEWSRKGGFGKGKALICVIWNKKIIYVWIILTSKSI